MQIEMSGIVCRYGDNPAVSGVDLTVGEGEFLALLGPSGSGKTTLLRVMAGLEVPEAGSLAIDGKDALVIPPNRRRIGFVFQNYALFRHMSVAKNIAFGLEVRPAATRPSKQQIRERVAELLDLVQLPGLGNRLPAQLSGGQRQRVALARALAVEPRILLLDEPFGALDAKVRAELGEWLKELHKRLSLTIVFVTHDQEEAMNLAQRLVVMRTGRIEQDGPPAQLYAEPATSFVYNFLGSANRLPCWIKDGKAMLSDGTSFDLPAGTSAAAGTSNLWFRPHQVALALLPPAASPGPWLPATVRDIAAAGPQARILLDHAGTTITAEMPAETLPSLALAIGKGCYWSPRNWRVYPE